ncbi:MAG TPA: response regulator [Usitatibacter sp.]|jgi:signal transduction histidine kinase|nr:response regulator [Usitatibacter sp.]
MADSAHASILIVDDDGKSLLAMEAVLRSLGSRLATARSGEEALRKVLDEDFAAILMDVRMPGIDGFTTARMIRERKRSRYTPIIFLTAAQEDLASMFRGYEAGAVDYIVKPVIPEVLRSKLSVFVGLHDMNRMLNAELAERAMTEQRLRTSEENLRALAAHLQSVREEERIHIAREIHDELGQALTGLKYDLGALTKGYGSDDREAFMQKAQAASQAIDRIINSVRRISSGLRPEVLDEIGLGAAIDWQAREFQRRTGVRCLVEMPPRFADPDKERSTALFRIFQELLTNVARHANATRVDVKLQDIEDEGLMLTVSDNGRGIRDDELQEGKSLGFLGLRERVLAFGGAIEVQGEEGKGTTVSVTIPTTTQQPVFHA